MNVGIDALPDQIADFCRGRQIGILALFEALASAVSDKPLEDE